MDLEIDARANCLFLSTALMILRITRDQNLPFSDLRQKKRRKHKNPLHLKLLCFLKTLPGEE